METVGFNLQVIRAIDNYLDTEVDVQYKEQPLAQDWARVGKVIEELGESIRALIGFTGQNPRKKMTHTLDDLFEELADTALTALFAMQHFAKDDKTVALILSARLKTLYERMPKEYQV